MPLMQLSAIYVCTADIMVPGEYIVLFSGDFFMVAC
jgi:hypothetical protein